MQEAIFVNVSSNIVEQLQLVSYDILDYILLEMELLPRNFTASYSPSFNPALSASNATFSFTNLTSPDFRFDKLWDGIFHPTTLTFTFLFLVVVYGTIIWLTKLLLTGLPQVIATAKQPATPAPSPKPAPAIPPGLQ